MSRLIVSVSALAVFIVTGLLILNPDLADPSNTPIRFALSIVLLFGLTFLSATLASAAVVREWNRQHRHE